MKRPDDEALRVRRWKALREMADAAPDPVYHHRTHGWECIPGIDADATLLESGVIEPGEVTRLYASSKMRWAGSRRPASRAIHGSSCGVGDPLLVITSESNLR